jgi:hypothetical protein
VDKIEELARVHPDRHDLLIRVMAVGGDYWPLPWYLRAFRHVGWYRDIPSEPAAPIIVASAGLAKTVEARLGNPWSLVGYFGLRPGKNLALIVQTDLWQTYLKTKTSASP